MDWPNSEQLGDFHNCMIRNKAEMPTGASHPFPWVYPCPPEAQLGSEQREQLSWNTFSEHFFFIFNVIYLCYGHWDRDKKTLEEAKQSPRVSQTRDTEWRVSNDGMFYMRLLPQLGEVLSPLPTPGHPFSFLELTCLWKSWLLPLLSYSEMWISFTVPSMHL